MIKVTGSGKKQTWAGFPKLMKSNTGTLVFFEANEKGVVLDASNYQAGFRSEDWAMSEFTDYEGSITIQNEVE